MKRSKLLFALTAALLVTPIIAGCDNNNTTTETAEEKVTAVEAALVYGSFKEGITKNVDLIKSIPDYEDVTISYSVADTAKDYLKVEGDVLVVTRPEVGAGDVALTKALVATITCGDVTVTKTFNIRIVEASPISGYAEVDTPEAGVAYKMGMDVKDKTVYFMGEMNGYYGATSTIAFLAEDMTLENTDGGYYLTFTDNNSAKKYIDVQWTSDKQHINFKIVSVPGVVFEWDNTINTLVTTIEDEKFFLGTSGTYSTFGPMKYETAADSYVAKFYQKTADFVEPVEMSITEANAAPDGTNAIVSGTVTAIDVDWDNSYKNMSVIISDAAGNTLYVFRTSTKVKVGDEVKITGQITSYGETKQMAQGSKLEITKAAAGGETDGDETGGDETITSSGSSTVTNADGSVTVTLDLHADVLTLVGSSYTDGSFTSQGIEYGYLQCKGNNGTAYGNTNPNYLMMKGSSGACIYNKTALPGAITSVKFVTNPGSSAKAVYYADVFTSVKAEAITSSHTITGIGTCKFNVDASLNASYFNITLDAASTKNGQINLIVITYIPAK